MAVETMQRSDMPSLKRNITLSTRKPIHRFLFATNSFSLTPQTVESLDIDVSIFNSSDDLDSLPVLAVGTCDSLSHTQVSEREDLHVYVFFPVLSSLVYLVYGSMFKLFVPEKQTRSLSESIRESLKAATSLLNTSQIDSLIVQLPLSFGSNASNSAVVTPASPAGTDVSDADPEPRRKSRRLLQKQVLPSPELNPSSDSSNEKDFIASVYRIARADFGIKRIGVSSTSIASLGEFLKVSDLKSTPIERVVFDAVNELRIVDVASKLDVLDSLCQSLGVGLTVSNDGVDGLAGASFDKLVEHVNKSTADPVSGVAQDWIAKYTVFGETRSVLKQHGYLIMGSTH
ncbi:UNVERIFIED_CONTAM: hypothetical protein HDU68_003948 [Siphonaria sp. JEL0065]|nr:hypothetical protein HDU68_003948 [Siphonaria sp. JEL0065]